MRKLLRVLSTLAIVALAAGLFAGATGAAAQDSAEQSGRETVGGFEIPLFGLSVRDDGRVIAADGSGIVAVAKGGPKLIAEIAGLSDAIAIGDGPMLAVSGPDEPPPENAPEALYTDAETRVIAPQSLFAVSRTGRTVRVLADLGAYEALVNPDGGEVDSNPFDLASVPGRALVADAGGNSLVRVNRHGNVGWIATFPTQMVSTADVKALFECPAGPPDICNLPPRIPAEAVPTTVAVGPDGHWYVGELVGFPSVTGKSRVWRVPANSSHLRCGVDPACEMVLDGLTAIIDMNFAADGTLYLAELDEAGWLAAEMGKGVGGAVNACDVDAGTCSEVADGIPILTAVATRGAKVFATKNALIPGMAEVIRVL